MSSKSQIERVLGDTQGELQAMNKGVGVELGHMRTKEKYLNNQFNTVGLQFVEVKHRLEELESKTSTSHEVSVVYMHFFTVSTSICMYVRM